MQTVERIFEYKDIPDEQKVTIVALKLRKYASLWWTNLLTKRVRQGKGKITNNIQNNYAALHHLTQGSMSVEEYN